MKKNLLVIFFILFSTSSAFAEERIINLVVDYKTVHFAGKARKAIAVNNQIPAPTLHFKEGDHLTVNVHNKLDQETVIHWHGILVPWQADGVFGITQKGIPPGGVFHYQFTLHQSGTYWYHAHAGLQEQQGLYGAFLIDPPQPPKYKYTKDYVIVLSDWSNTHPDKILSNLKKEGDYYSSRFPLQPSLAKFIHDYRKADKAERKQLIDDYKMMQEMRMSIYDISDVAFDAFLLNGQPKTIPWTAPVHIGDIVRLRFIGAGGSTIFHVKIPGTTMQMVHAQGNDVKPYAINDFTIAPGETYDVLVKIQKNDPYIIYAESIDTVGAAYGALITSPHQIVNYKHVTPFPEPLPVTREMMSMMMGNMNQGSLPINMNSMSHEMRMSHNIGKHSNHQSTSNSMKLDSNQKMNENLPMPHEMPMSHNTSNHSNHQSTSKATKMDSSQTMDESLPMNHTMPMNHKSSQNMNIPAKMSAHSNHSGMSGNMNINMNSGAKMSHGMTMNHSMNMDMPTEPTIIGDTISPPNSSYKTTYGTKYQNIIAAVKTNDPNTPIEGVINMELFGYMERFIWFINGVPEYKAHPILLKPGKRYRFVFTNTSMMRHPMHIHGHWFILRKGHGAYDPLLHTIDVAPGATITADVDADASGQWLFHCHLLYHMMSGMSRVFQYSTLIEITQNKATPQYIERETQYHNRPIVRVDRTRPIDNSLVKHPMAHSMGLWLATFLDVGADPFNNAQRLSYKGLYGGDYHKLELFINDAEISKGKVENADLDIFYWHLINQFWAIKGGVNYAYRPGATSYWQPGISVEGLLPYFIDVNMRGYFHSGNAKLDVELTRDTQITNNFFVRLGARGIAATSSGLNQMRYLVRPYYRMMPGLNAFAEYEHEQDYGSFKNVQNTHGEPTVQNTFTFGLSMLF